MSPTGQFICFLISLILVGVAAVIWAMQKAVAACLTAAAFGVFVFVFVVNAAKAM